MGIVHEQEEQKLAVNSLLTRTTWVIIEIGVIFLVPVIQYLQYFLLFVCHHGHHIQVYKETWFKKKNLYFGNLKCKLT